MKWRFVWFLASSCAALTLTLALPASLVEDVAANAAKDKKVKRAHGEIAPQTGEKLLPSPLYNNPTAIKRGGGGMTYSDWEEQNKEANLADLASALYATSLGNDLYDGKSILDYEKGYRYGANKDNLDEALENAILKSDLYGEPAGPYNQYRYFDERPLERKRRGTQKIRVGTRNKRDLNLTPEEILTLLALWEGDRKAANTNEYHPIWSRYESNDLENENDNNISPEENWLDTPVYPHAINKAEDYLKPTQNYYEDKRGQWGGFSDYNNKRKRFMVAKKRSDPTREVRYLNGPGQRDEFYTLSQLLANQRDPDAPLYHRMVL